MWHDIVHKSNDDGSFTSSGTGWTTQKTYIDLLEESIPSGVFAFRDCANVRKEINDTLRKICGSVTTLYKRVLVVNSTDTDI